MLWHTTALRMYALFCKIKIFLAYCKKKLTILHAYFVEQPLVMWAGKLFFTLIFLDFGVQASLL